jgi:hypothetical protein
MTENQIETWLLLKAIKDWNPKFWKISLKNWEYDWEKFTYNDYEIEFDWENLATIKQYIDWEYQPVSRLVKKEWEILDEFLWRAMELNEKLWETICFETR